MLGRSRAKEASPTRTLVFGAGPLGSLMAVRLREAGQDVTLLARGQRLENLNEQGVVLESGIDGPRTVTRVKTTDSLDPDHRHDLIMVIRRMNQAVKILPTLAANEHATTVLFLMNNFAGPEQLVEALGKERVMSGFPYPGGERIDHVILRFATNLLDSRTGDGGGAPPSL